MKKDLTQMSDYELSTHHAKEKQKELLSEQFQVVIKWPSLDNNLRITYLNKKSNKVVAIEELSVLEEIVSESTFKGKKCYGWCSTQVTYLKPLLSIKPNEWLDYNSELFIDEYFKKH